MINLVLLDDNSEEVNCNFSNFRLEARQAWLSEYPNMAAANHWHNDLEFIVILEGKMSYSVNGNSYSLRKGQGIFVNSDQMHYGYSADGSNCKFIFVLIHPSLFSDLDRIKKNYVIPVCTNKLNPFFIFDLCVTWQKNLINFLIEIYNLCTNKPHGFELKIMCIIFSILYILHDNIRNNAFNSTIYLNNNIDTLHNMVEYIHKNYHKKITLSDISSSGSVCKSSCCAIFKSILNKSPVAYLTEYRIEKSLELLTNSSYSITKIALKCGFNNSSYFSEVFHKIVGCSPSEYQKNKLPKF